MVKLSALDYMLILVIFALTLFVGVWLSRQVGKTSTEFFLLGRKMPWWLLGVSEVATRFAADTPGLVTTRKSRLSYYKNRRR